jgi:putative acetyltransferase
VVSIRDERPGDEAAIRAVVAAAFGREAEAMLVDEVRAIGVGLCSLVAVDGGRIVGHVLFTPATVGARDAALLGPLSVAPAHQGRGVGAALVRAGVARMAERGAGAVVLVGSPGYYSRFGFVPGAARTAAADSEHVLALALRSGVLDGGLPLVWHPLFDALAAVTPPRRRDAPPPPGRR